jgi:hypothetical protein
MPLTNPFIPQNDLFHETWTFPGVAGLKVICSQFDGYSPMLDGSIRTNIIETTGEKSGSISVKIHVRGSSLTCNAQRLPKRPVINPSLDENHIRIHKQDNSIFIETGGLSLMSYMTAPRLLIDVAISLPRSMGNLEIKTISLPVFLEGVEKANNVMIIGHSSPISVEKVEAHSLAVSNHSGSITFESSSKQIIDTFTKVTNSSGSTNLNSSLFSPSVSAETNSGSLGLRMKTTATEFSVKNSSGSLHGCVEYPEDIPSASSYENKSGSLNITLRGWNGFLTAATKSGSKKVGGSGLERWNDGWKRGTGESTASFKTQSGSLKVEVS